MKKLKIYENGKLIKTVTKETDLPNTYSPENHEPKQPKMDRTINRPSYKTLLENQKNNNKGLLFANGILMFFMVGTIVGCSLRVKQLKTEIGALESARLYAVEQAEAVTIDYNNLLVEYASCSAEIESKRIVGKVSFYSHDGCLGCGENQITASGEAFDENAYTLAIPVEWTHIKMGTIAIVKNLDNGKQMTAKVNDRGGFLKYNRVADLSKGLYEAIGAITDKSNIEITF